MDEPPINAVVDDGSLGAFKAKAFVAVLLVALGGGLLPLLVRDVGGARERLLALGNTYSGGLFLCAGFTHMLAESLEAFLAHELPGASSPPFAAIAAARNVAERAHRRALPPAARHTPPSACVFAAPLIRVAHSRATRRTATSRMGAALLHGWSLHHTLCRKGAARLLSRIERCRCAIGRCTLALALARAAQARRRSNNVARPNVHIDR